MGPRPHRRARIPLDGRIAKIRTALLGAGFSSPYAKYFVYFDGPTNDANICGQGGGQPDVGPSFAVVYARSCSLVSTAGVAVHELLHALRALNDPGPPHACPDGTRVVRSDGGISCPKRCSGALTSYEAVALKSTPPEAGG